MYNQLYIKLRSILMVPLTTGVLESDIQKLEELSQSWEKPDEDSDTIVDRINSQLFLPGETMSLENKLKVGRFIEQIRTEEEGKASRIGRFFRKLVGRESGKDKLYSKIGKLRENVIKAI